MRISDWSSDVCSSDLAIIAYPGGIKGIGHVHDVMADETIAAFLDRIETDEILPIVPPVPGQDLDDYKRLILDRFANPEIADTAQRLCFDGSNRQQIGRASCRERGCQYV